MLLQVLLGQNSLEANNVFAFRLYYECVLRTTGSGCKARNRQTRKKKKNSEET